MSAANRHGRRPLTPAELAKQPHHRAILRSLAGSEDDWARTWISFKTLQTALGLTDGNLSSHMQKLTRAGMVRVRKRFVGSFPRTEYTITKAGRRALSGRP